MAARSRRSFPVRVLQEPDWNPLWITGGGGNSRSLFDRLVGGMQDHLDEMERMRVVLLDAYPLLALDDGDAGFQARKGAARRAGGGGGPASKASSTARAHHFALDLSGFSPEEVKVSLDGRKLTVHAKSERRAEAEDGCLSYEAREVRRELLLPEDADLEAVSTALALDGHLCIEAPRQAPPPPQERVIPITVVSSKDEDGAAKKKKKAEEAEKKEEGAVGGK